MAPEWLHVWFMQHHCKIFCICQHLCISKESQSRVWERSLHRGPYLKEKQLSFLFLAQKEAENNTQHVGEWPDVVGPSPQMKTEWSDIKTSDVNLVSPVQKGSLSLTLRDSPASVGIITEGVGGTLSLWSCSCCVWIWFDGIQVKKLNEKSYSS